jgi:hypothetical protein
MALPEYLERLRVRYEQDEEMRLSEEQLKQLYGEEWMMHDRRPINTNADVLSIGVGDVVAGGSSQPGSVLGNDWKVKSYPSKGMVIGGGDDAI